MSLRRLFSSSSSAAVSANNEEAAASSIDPSGNENVSNHDAKAEFSSPKSTTDNLETTIVSQEEEDDDDDESLEEEYCHSLQIGDHVIRWTMIGFVYPIQIHGIVLSVGPDAVAIADFGYTSYKSVEGKEEVQDEVLDAETEEMKRKAKGKKRLNVVTLVGKKEIRRWKKVNYGGEEEGDGKGSKLGKLTSWFKRGGSKDVIEDDKAGASETDDLSSLECKPHNLAIEAEAQLKDDTKSDLAGNETCKEEVTKSDDKFDRCTSEISEKELTLDTKPNEWKTGNIAEIDNDLMASKFPPKEAFSFDRQQHGAESALISTGENVNTEIENALIAQQQEQQHDGDESALKPAGKNENALIQADQKDVGYSEFRTMIPTTTNEETQLTSRQSSFKNWFQRKKSSDLNEKDEKKPPEQQPPPKRQPNCDPTEIVVARVRFLLENESLLPPYHILYSNSECIAVWCKTGTWSTLQASIFLHSTAVGNTKSTISLSLFLSAQTVTVPATGWAGFWGGTTQVSLLSTQPWIIPAIAGYGICAIGMPYVILIRCRGKWEKTTSEMNDLFWGMASPSVFVEAINQWASLG